MGRIRDAVLRMTAAVAAAVALATLVPATAAAATQAGGSSSRPGPGSCGRPGGPYMTDAARPHGS